MAAAVAAAAVVGWGRGGRGRLSSEKPDLSEERDTEREVIGAGDCHSVVA